MHLYEFEASLVYRESSRTGRVVRKKTCLKKEKKKEAHFARTRWIDINFLLYIFPN